MLSLLIISFFIGLTIVAIYARIKKQCEEYEEKEKEDANIIIGISIFFLIGCIVLVFGLPYDEHLTDQEEYIKLNKSIPIYQERMSTISMILKEELSKYVKHETEIFKDFKLDKLKIYLVRYPELKSNEVIMKLAEELKQLTDSIYHIQLKMLDVQKSLRARKRSLFVLILPGDPQI